MFIENLTPEEVEDLLVLTGSSDIVRIIFINRLDCPHCHAMIALCKQLYGKSRKVYIGTIESKNLQDVIETMETPILQEALYSLCKDMPGVPFFIRLRRNEETKVEAGRMDKGTFVEFIDEAPDASVPS